MTFTGLIGRICMFPLRLIIDTCVKLRIHPNTLTFIGVLINFAAASALALGKFVTARDHLFPTRTWQLDDAELTIPGGSCPGAQIMLASHNDSTPFSTNGGGPSSQAVGGSLTPLSTMHSGNWGNGSAYDANMGELMNLEEIGSVLRWHEVNGTYPARTIKATLYDNEEGGLVGSGDYSAVGTQAAILSTPTAVGDTNIQVTSTSNLAVW